MKELLGTVVSVSVPARPELVRVLRSVVGGVAARLDLSYDEIDDLRIAVDEACATLLEVGSSEGRLSLELRPAQNGLTMTATAESDGLGWPSDAQGSLAWRVLTALMDEAEFETTEGHLVIRMRKGRPNGG